MTPAKDRKPYHCIVIIDKGFKSYYFLEK